MVKKWTFVSSKFWASVSILNDLFSKRNFFSGFDRYKGGLDTVHDLTGLHSVCTHWRGIEIMFHVSTLLPHEENDPQKVSKHFKVLKKIIG